MNGWIIAACWVGPITLYLTIGAFSVPRVAWALAEHKAAHADRRAYDYEKRDYVITPAVDPARYIRSQTIMALWAVLAWPAYMLWIRSTRVARASIGAGVKPDKATLEAAAAEGTRQAAYDKAMAELNELDPAS